MSTSTYIGPASAIVANGGYACEVRKPCGTEVFCDGKITIEVPKARVNSSLGAFMPQDSQPFAELVMKGSYVVYLDEGDHMEVFEGGYVDEEQRRVSVRCHVGAVYAVPSSARRPGDGMVNLSNGSGIIPSFGP